MPRTKVSKSVKRFREESNREEKVREFEASLDSFLDTIERKCKQQISEIESDLHMVRQRTNATLLQMRMGDFLEMNLRQLTGCDDKSNISLIAASNSAHSQTLFNGTKLLNPNDEGYLTEDSSNGGSAIGVANTLAAYTSVTRASSSSSSSTQQLLSLSTAASAQQQQRGRTPGPLSSARARRPRRSRSACGDYVPGSALQPKPSSNNSGVLESHASRSKMRTPMASRSKAFSAERTPQLARQTLNAHSPPAAFMRWPKPGEMVLSKCGSPLVAQFMPDSCANVNIPVRNGVLSLRPKKLADLKPDLVRDINPETLNQIKTLHANLNLIMKMADSNK